MRNIIDEEVRKSNSLEEFKENLLVRGVTLTRCSETVISYKFGEHKAVRGDTLGGNYTIQAVKSGLNPEDRTEFYKWGEMANVARPEIDRMVEESKAASWDEKMALWKEYSVANSQFWDEYQSRLRSIQNAKTEALRLNRRVKMAEWMLDPRNRHRTLLGMIIAKIYLLFYVGAPRHWNELDNVQEEMEQLRDSLKAYKAAKGEFLPVMKQKNLPLEEYAEAVKKVQKVAENIFFDVKRNHEYGRISVKEWLPKEKNQDLEQDIDL